MATATGDRVYDALKNLKDLSDARELMSLLNYEYDSAPLRMGKLPDDTRAVMAGEPQARRLPVSLGDNHGRR